MFNFLKKFTEKKQPQKEPTIDLTRWRRFLAEGGPSIRDVSKYESDKAKILLLTSYEAKGLTPAPGFHHF
jgi:hypothetical protein